MSILPWMKESFRLDQAPSQSDESQWSSARILSGCTFCHSLFGSEAEFQAHVHAQFCEKPCLAHFCSQCFFQAPDKLVLRQHILQSHTVMSRDFPCQYCPASFKSLSGLKMHEQVKHSTNPTLRCPICGKIMYNKINLDGHINKHNGVKPHSCVHCGRSFSYKQSLQAHLKLCSARPSPIPTEASTSSSL